MTILAILGTLFSKTGIFRFPKFSENIFRKISVGFFPEFRNSGINPYAECFLLSAFCFLFFSPVILRISDSGVFCEVWQMLCDIRMSKRVA